MATAKTQRSQQEIALEESRATTDSLLGQEREHADVALREKEVIREQHAEEERDRTRAQVGAALQTAAKQAESKAATRAAESSALEAKVEDAKQQVAEVADAARLRGAPSDATRQVKEVTEQALDETKRVVQKAITAEKSRAREAVATVAEQIFNAEREQVDKIAATERRGLRRDFLEVLLRERKETDEALGFERAISDLHVRTRDDMLAMIAHDLGNYLNVIRLKAELLAKTSEVPDPYRRLADQIGSACEIMQRWANDLVDISSMDAGEVYVESTPQDPREIASASRQAFHDAATARGVQICLDAPEQLPPIRGDRERLVQVLNNLLDNALKFITGTGTITIKLEPAGDYVRFSVADTGPGIPAEDQSKIFDRYWHTEKDAHGGTGLGLFICRRIIEAHGGQISVESEPERGSTFTFTIPIVKP